MDNIVKEKVATIIPIHQPKFKYGLEALKSYHEFSDNKDLYFIFSNEQELNLFNSLTDLPFKHLITPSDVDISVNPTIKKKLFGTKYLFDEGFDLVGALDADILFVNSFDPKLIYSDISNQNYFKSNLSTSGGNIIKHIANQLELVNNPKLLSQTSNYTHYWWFNEICVYEKNLFLEFYEWLLSLNNSKRIIDDFWCFDYLVYSVWLIVFKDYNLKLPDSVNYYDWGALEHNFYSKDLSYKFNSYADAYALSDRPEHIKIRLHVDRTPQI